MTVKAQVFASRLLLPLALAAVPVAALAVIAPPANAQASGTATLKGQKANLHGSADVAGKSSIEVEMDDNYFSPTILKGTPGQSLTVDLHNEGKMAHTFTLPSEGVDTVVQPGKEATVHITFPRSGGRVLFYCRFHAQLGMRGALELVSAPPVGGVQTGAGGTADWGAREAPAAAAVGSVLVVGFALGFGFARLRYRAH
jgi:plastocyanin